MVSNLYELPDLYDALLPVRAHLPFYRELAKQHPASVLELACGTGQLAVPIAADGIPTTGLDSSPAMLASARNRASAARVAVDWIDGDMRDFHIDRRFALVFVARNSLLHVSSAEDIVSSFAAIRRHLAPGGVFAFDVFNPDVRILARPKAQRYPVLEADGPSFGRLRVEGSHDYDAASQVDRGTWYISTRDERDKWVVSVAVRSIFPQELPLLLQAAGLRMSRRFGNFAGELFVASSPHQVCLCESAG